MESIERIGPPAPLEMGGPDGHIGTMRDFLAKPRVARDFQDLKADSHRLESLRAELTTLTQRAAEAEIHPAPRLATTIAVIMTLRVRLRCGIALLCLRLMLLSLRANISTGAGGFHGVQLAGHAPSSWLPTWLA